MSGKRPQHDGDDDEAALLLRARRLLERWTQLAQAHVALGSGCSCGLGAGSVRLQDFEQDVLDYLHGRYGHTSAVAALLRRHAGYLAGAAGSVTDLLDAIAAGRAQAPVEAQAAALADIGRSVDSFDELHRRHAR
ncbi:MAG TPA: hypothetical protein VMK05_01680 [Burkholderiales bacterium]|nr:hypothetical protein [Burkholderiales bacterium]